MLSQVLISCLLVASVYSWNPWPPKPPPPPPPPPPHNNQPPPDPKLQPATGSFDFVYHQQETKDAAMKYIGIYTNAQKWLQGYLDGLKNTNQALQLYKKYEAAAYQVKGTPCDLSDDDKVIMEEALEDITDTVNTCVQALSYKDFDAVKDVVTQNLVIVQNIDNNVTLNLQHCLSPFYPRSYCMQLFYQDKDNLRKATSQDIFSGIFNMIINAVKKAINEVNQCIDEDTSCTVDDINEGLDKIVSCRG